MRREDSRLVVELHGELDVAMVLAIEDPLSDELRLPTTELVLDMRLLTFVDCSGIALIERLRQRLELTDARMFLICTDPFVLRILSYLGVPDSIPILSSPPQQWREAQPSPDGS
ncbi:STAS domain-containing protein [Streptomyces sp. TRM66268-LWL]|uniref:Anti-sigma factor antagonist n=1 Tax=Streptomyces polyasparticus TaxID=2767826 RepID=A0ABR7SDV0_9ACTN|nr:STAS domain-containing protein [Streptomyces polyasparticus]MBC9713676.1 STAS domain-containing protein [Streptomyces polyasparticus]